jgi:hypothetical protein
MPTRRDALATIRRAALILTFLFTGTSQAALVRGTYEGLVNQEGGGLGLIGATMRVDMTYDDSAMGIPNPLGELEFANALRQLSISIAGNHWQWDALGGTSRIQLKDGTTDHFQIRATRFTGPDLLSAPAIADQYVFVLELYDFVPSGAPNGITNASKLPSAAPDPALFEPSPSGKALIFQFQSGGPSPSLGLLMTTEFIASPVPVPAAGLMLGTGASLLLGIRRRRKHA